MHAIVVLGTLDKYEEAMSDLHDKVIPGLKSLPGFQGGTWLVNRATGEGVSVVVFDSAEAVKFIADNTPPGDDHVTRTHIGVYEVVAQEKV